MFSLLRPASKPIGYEVKIGGDDKTDYEVQTQDSTTLWSTVADHVNKRYYFQSTILPSLFWVNLSKINFDKDSDIVAYKLELNELNSEDIDESLAGNVGKELMKGGKTKNDFDFFTGIEKNIKDKIKEVLTH